MSLKAFHLVFIVFAFLLAVACAWWAFAKKVEGAFGAGACVVAALLVVYGFWFVKKSRHIIT